MLVAMGIILMVGGIARGRVATPWAQVAQVETLERQPRSRLQWSRLLASVLVAMGIILMVGGIAWVSVATPWAQVAQPRDVGKGSRDPVSQWSACPFQRLYIGESGVSGRVTRP